MSGVKIISDATSEEFLAANKNSFVVLLFDAEFTEQQNEVKKALEFVLEAPELKDKIVVGSVDVEQNNDLAKQLEVVSVPIVVCVVNGKVVKKVDTLEPTKLVKTIEEQLKRHQLSSGDTSDKTDPKEKFNHYLKQLVNRAPVMVFMKGDPTAPRCGFSRQLVELLAKNDLKYETFDILLDDDVRQGLKEYSDWPTYPQIYVKGEFVGGLDILKQLDETGELVKTLQVE